MVPVLWGGGERNPPTPFHSIQPPFTSILPNEPQLNLNFASVAPCLVKNLEPQFGNHGLQNHGSMITAEIVVSMKV